MTEVPTQATPTLPVATAPVLDATNIIKESFSFYKRSFPEFIGLAAIHFGVSFLFGLLIGIVVIGGGASVLLLGNPLTEQGGVSFLSWTLLIGLILVLLIVVAGVWFMSWAQLALMHFILSRENPLAIKEAFARAQPQVLPYLITTFWSGLATFGVFALCTLVFGVVAVLGVVANSAPLTIVGMLLGLVVMVVAIITTTVWFAFTPWIFVSENIQGRKVVALSKELSKGIFGRVLGAFFLIGLLYLLVSAAISLLSSLILGQYSTYLDSVIDGLFLFPLLLIAGGGIYSIVKKSRESVLHSEVDTKLITYLASLGGAFLVAIAGAFAYMIVSVGPEALYRGAYDILAEIEQSAGLTETQEAEQEIIPEPDIQVNVEE